MPQKSPTTDTWPFDYVAILMQRQKRLRKVISKGMQPHARAYYKDHPIEFIEHWAVTYDPRNATNDLPTTLPFILFDRQKDLVNWLVERIEGQSDGLVEKSRDMGATWVCAAFSVWLWLFKGGASVGWGSRKEQLVDRLGDPDSIFEKMRVIIRHLPSFLKPTGLNEKEHMHYMKIINPENGSTITGEAGDNIGRGGRSSIYFKDESAHYERAEMIEAALADNTNVQIDISSVNGTGNVFHRKRQSGMTDVFILDWRDHPGKDQAWYDGRKAKAESEGLYYLFAQEVDRDYSSSVEGILIPAKYVKAAIDAHIRLGFKAKGVKTVGLDVADSEAGKGDKNAYVYAYGPVVLDAKHWSDDDVGKTAIEGYNYAVKVGADKLVYDSIGVGAGVKSKARELQRGMPSKTQVAGFNSGGKVARPEKQYTEGKKNKDMFANIKAQAWWGVRDRFRKTYQAVEKGDPYNPSDLISLSSDLPFLDELVMELSRPKGDTDNAGRVKVESKKDMKKRGVPSPNIADALIMCLLPETRVQIHVG